MTGPVLNTTALFSIAPLNPVATKISLNGIKKKKFKPHKLLKGMFGKVLKDEATKRRIVCLIN